MSELTYVTPVGVGNFNFTLSFTNEGRLLAVIQGAFPACLLDTETWETALTFDTHATAAASSPENERLALALGCHARIGDMRACYESIGCLPVDEGRGWLANKLKAMLPLSHNGIGSL